MAPVYIVFPFLFLKERSILTLKKGDLDPIEF